MFTTLRLMMSLCRPYKAQLSEFSHQYVVVVSYFCDAVCMHDDYLNFLFANYCKQTLVCRLRYVQIEALFLALHHRL